MSYILIAGLCTIISTPLIGMIPGTAIPNNFVPHHECPITQKMYLTLDNLPNPLNFITIKMLSSALTGQASLPKPLRTFLSLYCTKITYSPYHTDQCTTIVSLTYKVRDYLRYVLQESEKKYYLQPETLIALSAIVEHQVLTTHGLINTEPPQTLHFVHKYEKQQLKIRFNEIIPPALQKREYLNSKNERSFYMLALLTYDVILRKHTPETNPLICDLAESVRQHKDQFSIISAYVRSKIRDDKYLSGYEQQSAVGLMKERIKKICKHDEDIDKLCMKLINKAEKILSPTAQSAQY